MFSIEMGLGVEVKWDWGLRSEEEYIWGLW